MNWKTFLPLSFLVACSAGAEPGPDPAPARPPDRFVSLLQKYGFAAVPFRPNFYVQPVCTLQVDGSDIRAFPDTGAMQSVLTESAAARLGLDFLDKTTTVSIPGATDQTSRIAIADNVTATGIALGPMTNLVFPHRIEDPQDRADLAIGLSYLDAHSALIDYGRGYLFLHPPGPKLAGMEEVLKQIGYSRIPILREGRQLYIDGQVNGIPARLLVDSGTSRCYLYKHWAEAHAIPLNVSTMRIDGVAMNAADLYVAGVTNLTIGNRTDPNPEIRAFACGDTNRPEAGFLGSLDFLLLGAIVDTTGNGLYLPRHAPPPPPAKTGGGTDD